MLQDRHDLCRIHRTNTSPVFFALNHDMQSPRRRCVQGLSTAAGRMCRIRDRVQLHPLLRCYFKTDCIDNASCTSRVQTDPKHTMRTNISSTQDNKRQATMYFLWMDKCVPSKTWPHSTLTCTCCLSLDRTIQESQILQRTLATFPPHSHDLHTFTHLGE